MKHLKWTVALVGLALVPVLAVASLASAQKFNTTVDKGHTINSSLYSAGKVIDISGTVNGDIFCAGQTVKVDAVVHGDVICAGQDVTVSGKIDGNIRLAGQTVSVDANIAKNATVAAMNFSLDASAKIGQDITASGDTINLKGRVGRDVLSNGNSVTLNGFVGRNAKANSSHLRLKNSAVLAGNLEYTSPNKAQFDKGSNVQGNTHRIATAQKKRGWHFNAMFYLFAVAGLLLISLALAYLFPAFMRKGAAHIDDNFTKTLIIGLVASFLVPMICLGLALSLIGIPLTLFALIAWLFGALLSGPITAYYVGQKVLKKQKNPYIIATVGSLILVTAYFLPIAGILVLMLAYWLGFGSLLQSLKAHARPYQTKQAG